MHALDRHFNELHRRRWTTKKYMVDEIQYMGLIRRASSIGTMSANAASSATYGMEMFLEALFGDELLRETIK